MTKMEHTPGPWEITRLKGELDGAYWIGPEEYTTIAKVEHGADDEEYGGPRAQLANALLIAAAPELLAYARCNECFAANFSREKSEAVFRECGWDGNEDYGNFIQRIGLAAIAKATGKEAA